MQLTIVIWKGGKLIDKLSSNETSRVGIITSDSKDVSNKFVDQCIKIINNKEGFNGLKCGTKIESRESLFKYQSHVYNIQRNSDVNYRGTKMWWNNKHFS